MAPDGRDSPCPALPCQARPSPASASRTRPRHAGPGLAGPCLAVPRRTPTRPIASTLLLALATAACMCASASSASAQYPDPNRRIVQVSGRLYNGFGFSRGIPHGGLMGDTGIRADAIWGKPGDEHFRFGPQLDIRSSCTLPVFLTCIHNMSLEAGLGPTLLIPFRRGYPIQISPNVGYAFRRDIFGGDGFYLSNTLSWGYRPYNHHGYWQLDFGPSDEASAVLAVEEDILVRPGRGVPFDLHLVLEWHGPRIRHADRPRASLDHRHSRFDRPAERGNT